MLQDDPAKLLIDLFVLMLTSRDSKSILYVDVWS